MTDTNLIAFNNGVASYLVAYIYPSIVRGLSSKGVTTSVEELSYFTNTPVVHPPSVGPNPINMSSAGFGAVPTMISSVQPTKKPSSAVSTATSEAIPGRTCIYRFKRGVKKGLCCGKNTVGGNDYCNACMKSHKITGNGEEGGSPGVAPGVNNIPGASGFPVGYNHPTFAVPATETEAAQPGKIDVEAFDSSRGLYINPTHKFVILDKPGKGIVVIGKFNKDTNKIDQLTSEEANIAKSIGLQISERSDLTGEQPNVSQQLPQGLPPLGQPSYQQFPQAVQQNFQPQQNFQQFPQTMPVQTNFPPMQEMPQVLSQLQGLTTVPQPLAPNPQQSPGTFTPNPHPSPETTPNLQQSPGGFSIPQVPQLDDGVTAPQFN